MCFNYTIHFITLFSGLLHTVRDSFDFAVLNFWQFGKNVTFILDLEDRNMKQLLKRGQQKKSENQIDVFSEILQEMPGKAFLCQRTRLDSII